MDSKTPELSGTASWREDMSTGLRCSSKWSFHTFPSHTLPQDLNPSVRWHSTFPKPVSLQRCSLSKIVRSMPVTLLALHLTPQPSSCRWRKDKMSLHRHFTSLSPSGLCECPCHQAHKPQAWLQVLFLETLIQVGNYLCDCLSVCSANICIPKVTQLQQHWESP